MVSIAPHVGRIGRPLWAAVARNLSSWAAVGTIVALTGFGPEHWFAAAFKYFESPQVGLAPPSWLDLRAVIVSIGVAIVVIDQLWRRLPKNDAANLVAAGVAAGPANLVDAQERVVLILVIDIKDRNQS